MPNIITVSDLQRNIGKIAQYVVKMPLFVTSRGKPRVVVLPYFDQSDDAIERYLEDYEMHCNRDALKKEYEASDKSGLSSYSI